MNLAAREGAHFNAPVGTCVDSAGSLEVRKVEVYRDGRHGLPLQRNEV
jgi:hypothetical protein